MIVTAIKKQDWDAAEANFCHACIECGSCAFQCPAHIPLVQYIRMGKLFIRGKGNGGHNPFYQAPQEKKQFTVKGLNEYYGTY